MQNQESRYEAGEVLMENKSSLGQGALNYELMPSCSRATGTHQLSPAELKGPDAHLEGADEALRDKWGWYC